MSDEALRELERRWKETGALSDRVALLVARLRTGQVTQQRVGLAAHLRDEAAAQIVPPPQAELQQLGRHGVISPRAHERLAPFSAWAVVFEVDPQAAIRVALVSLRWTTGKLATATLFPRGLPSGDWIELSSMGPGYPAHDMQQRQLEELIEKLERLALDWTEGCRLAVLSAAAHFSDDMSRFDLNSLGWIRAVGSGALEPPEAGWLASVCRGAAVFLLAGRQCEEHEPEGGPRRGRMAVYSIDPCPRCLFRDVLALQSAAQLEVAPWLLGDDDVLLPLSSRVPDQTVASEGELPGAGDPRPS